MKVYMHYILADELCRSGFHFKFIYIYILLLRAVCAFENFTTKALYISFGI